MGYYDRHQSIIDEASKFRNHLSLITNKTTVDNKSIYVLQLRFDNQPEWRTAYEGIPSLQEALEIFELRDAENEVTQWRILNVTTVREISIISGNHTV